MPFVALFVFPYVFFIALIMSAVSEARGLVPFYSNLEALK